MKSKWNDREIAKKSEREIERQKNGKGSRIVKEERMQIGKGSRITRKVEWQGK
jgi:hypothetical protein